MAAWTLRGVGRHYFLPSPEDCRITYLEIENLVTFERSYNYNNSSVETENKMLKKQVQELWMKIAEIQAKLNEG